MPFRTFRLRTESNSLAHVMRLTRPPQREVWEVGGLLLWWWFGFGFVRWGRVVVEGGEGDWFVCFVWRGAKFTFELRCFTGLNLINLSRCQARRWFSMFDYLFISLNRPSADCILVLPPKAPYSTSTPIWCYTCSSTSAPSSSVETPRIAVFAILLHLFIYYFVRILLCVFHECVYMCVCGCVNLLLWNLHNSN